MSLTSISLEELDMNPIKGGECRLMGQNNLEENRMGSLQNILTGRHHICRFQGEVLHVLLQLLYLTETQHSWSRQDVGIYQVEEIHIGDI